MVNSDPWYEWRAQRYASIMDSFNERSRVAAVDAMLRQAGINGFTTLIAQDLLQQLADQVMGETKESVRVIAASFDKSITDSRRGRLKELYTQVAQESVKSIDRAYMRRPNKTRSSAEGIPYRSNERFTGGALRRALSSPNMYRVSSDGISFINPVWLDSQARQWYRLNFGAGGRGKSGPKGRSYHMKLFGQTLPGDIGLTQYRPSAGFFLPPGWWSSGKGPEKWGQARRGQDFFMLGSASPLWRKKANHFRPTPTPSLGIQGSRFLDAGVGRMVQLFPIAIETVVNEWFAEAKAKGGPFRGPHVNASTRAVNQGFTFGKSIISAHEQNIRTRRFTRSL